MFFGYVVGFVPEPGYFSLNQLQNAKRGMRGLRALPIERDVWFEPKPLSETTFEDAKIKYQKLSAGGI